MHFKKYFSSFFPKNKPEDHEAHHKRKMGVGWWNHSRWKFRILYAFIGILFLFFATAAFAQAPTIRLLAESFTKPKPITQSSTVLPVDIQSAIQDLASQEIKQGQANANLAGGVSSSSTTQTSPSGLAQPLIDSIQEAFTTYPVDKAKIRLRIIDRQIQELEALTKNNKSDKAVDKAASLIKTIGEETGQIVSDPKAQADREVLTTLIQQYNRLQLVVQKVEDQLPIASYLKIDDARETYLEKGAKDSLNSAPNLEVVNNIGIKEVSKVVGSDFAELKAIEILSDLEAGLKPETKVKLGGIEKELALQFEKRILSLPPDVRNRKLQGYINYSYGNPLNQVQAFNRMQDFLTDRDLILSVESLKELSLKNLETRVLEINTPQLEAQFNNKVLTSPEDIKILIQMKMDIDAGKDESKKQIIAGLAKRAQEASIPIFGKDKNTILHAFPTKDVNTDLLDVVLISQVDQVLNGSPTVSADVKQTVQDVKQKTLQNFLISVSKNGFLTQSKLAYNPVPVNADVRLLLPAPQAILALEAVKNELPNQDKAKITLAERAESNILANHLLLQVNDPAIFEKYQQFIMDNPQVKQTIQSYVGQNFFTTLAQKKKLIDKHNLQEQQALYEKMQQIVQSIFAAGDKAHVAAALPSSIQNEITQIKQGLSDNSVPKLTTPPDVTLPKVAALPSDVQDALIALAKSEIKDKQSTNQTKLDIAAEAKDLGVSIPTILPDNPLYPLKNIIREIPILLTSDPVQKAKELIKIDNEKTIEAAALVEKSQSTTSVDAAIKTLNSVKQDFETLQANVGQVKQAEQTEPAKVDALVNQVIADGVVRQTIISSIENKVHGDAYVAVEQIRQDILKDGVDTLLAVTDNNVQKLTDKLEATVTSNTQTPTTTVASDIKAVELLNEIARTQPESAQKVLQTGEATIATSLEKTLLSQPPALQAQEVSSVSQEATGNPVRQFEALEVLKDDFKNPQTILLAEGLKNKATENLQERIAEIPDANTQKTFADQVIGNQPQDLKAVTEIASQVSPPKNAGVVEALPIVQQVDAIKADIVQNIVETYKDKPEELAKTDFFTHNPTPDVVDIKVAQTVETALSSSSDVKPEVVQVAKQEETKIIDTFVENVSKPQFQVTASTNTQTAVQTNTESPSQAPQNTQTTVSAVGNTTNTSVSAQTNVTALAAETLNPAPDTLATLVELKTQVPASEQAKIDIAITTEVAVIQNNLVNQVTDPATLQTYVAQITDNPVVAKTVAQVGGQQFTQAVEQKAQAVQVQATQDQTQLQTAVASIQQQVFSTPINNPSPVEQTLPQPVQQEIQQIKQEVPAAQIPQVSVAAQTETKTTVAAQPVDTTPVTTTVTQPVVASTPAPQPAQEQAPSSPAAATSTPQPPAPAAPQAPAPQTQSAPEQPAVPAAPAAPGL